MRHDEFEKELGPGLRIELGRPPGQGLALDATEEPRPPEGRIGEHRNLAIAGQRQDCLLHVAIVDRVIHADEIERLGFHVPDQVVVLIGGRSGDAEVAHATLGLQILEKLQLSLRAPVECK